MNSLEDEIENAFFSAMQKLDGSILEVENSISLNLTQDEIDFYMDQVGEKAAKLAKRWETMKYIL